MLRQGTRFIFLRTKLCLTEAEWTNFVKIIKKLHKKAFGYLKVKRFSYIIIMYNYKLMHWERIGICCFCFEQGAFFAERGLTK